MRALASETELTDSGEALDIADVSETANRGHAAALACRAMREGVELVVALGGDGTINEVVNGILTDGVHSRVPALGIIAAGSTNVFARALGLPTDPLEATGNLLDALREDRRRTVNLGQADDRFFVFTAGMGLDAAIVRNVETQRRRGARSSHSLYVRTGLRTFFAEDRRHPALTVEFCDGTPSAQVFFTIVTNTDPWTYLGERPVRPTPDASFMAGVDLYARRRIGTASMLWALGQVLRSPPKPGGRSVVVRHDLSAITVTANRPVPFQVDGDWLGDRERVEFRSVPRALTIVG